MMNFDINNLRKQSEKLSENIKEKEGLWKDFEHPVCCGELMTFQEGIDPDKDYYLCKKCRSVDKI
jgi:hypothetical protein